MDRGDSHQIYHFNLLKRWQEETSVELAVAVSAEEDLGPEAAVKVNPLALVPGGDHLSPLLLTDVAKLQTDFADVFSPLPGRTDLIQHHIEMIPRELARSCPYRLPEHKKKVVQDELKAMLELGVIEESHRPRLHCQLNVTNSDFLLICDTDRICSMTVCKQEKDACI